MKVNLTAKNSLLKQAGKKKRRYGGNKFLPACCPAPKARLGWEAAAYSASAEGQSRKFFFLKGKIKKGKGAPKNEWKNFLLCSPQGERRRWAGLPPCGRQLKVAVRIFVKKGSDFVQKVPPIFNFRVFEVCCLALASLGLGKSRDFIRIFEIQKQFLPAQTEVRFGGAKSKTKFCKPIFFSFAFGERQSDNFKYFDCPIIKTI